jgi:hypothetical protein
LNSLSRDLPDFRAVITTFLAFVTILLVGLAVPRGEFVIVVASPGMTQSRMMQLISDADGTFVTQGNLDWIAVAHAEKSGFVSRLFRAGALLVLDHALAAGCLERK